MASQVIMNFTPSFFFSLLPSLSDIGEKDLRMANSIIPCVLDMVGKSTLLLASCRVLKPDRKTSLILGTFCTKSEVNCNKFVSDSLLATEIIKVRMILAIANSGASIHRPGSRFGPASCRKVLLNFFISPAQQFKHEQPPRIRFTSS